MSRKEQREQFLGMARAVIKFADWLGWNKKFHAWFLSTWLRMFALHIVRQTLMQLGQTFFPCDVERIVDAIPDEIDDGMETIEERMKGVKV